MLKAANFLERAKEHDLRELQLRLEQLRQQRQTLLESMSRETFHADALMEIVRRNLDLAAQESRKTGLMEEESKAALHESRRRVKQIERMARKARRQARESRQKDCLLDMMEQALRSRRD